MSTVVLASASGAPGVTTTALGLTLAWPGEVTLVDADRAAAQTVLAGYLSGRSTHGMGLQGVLQAFRERRPLAEALAANRLVLPPAPPGRGAEAAQAPARWFVPGFARLGSVDLFESVWAPLLDGARTSGVDLVVDAGRVGHRGLPPDLVGGADVVGLVCRTSLVSLAALRLHVPPLVDAGAPGRVGLVLVGPGRPYGAREVAGQFGVPVLAEVPWEPRAASDLLEGGPLPRGWAHQSLGRSFARAASGLLAGANVGVRPAGVPA